MKWFRMDSDTPNHPTSRRVIKSLGNEGFGGLVRLWCFAAAFGKDEPGRCVDSDCDPFNREALIDASGLSDEAFDALIEVCLETKCAERTAWENRGELAFPGMRSRSDSYSKQLLRRNIVETSKKVQQTFPTRQHSTEEHKRIQKGSALDVDVLREKWNQITTPPIPRCQALSDKRRRAASLRLEEHGLDLMIDGFAAINSSRFCRGENERGWRATFDWAVKPDVCVRAIEGKYEGATKAGKARSSKPGKYDKVEKKP